MIRGKELALPVLQGGMGVGISLDRLAGAVAARIYLSHNSGTGGKEAPEEPHKTQIAGNDNFFGEEDRSDK